MQNASYPPTLSRRKIRSRSRPAESLENRCDIGDLNGVVHDVLLLLAPVSDEGTRIHCTLARSPLIVGIKASELYSIVYHLLSHAVNAANHGLDQRKYRGEVAIVTGSSNAGKREAFVEISDNGDVLPENVKYALSSDASIPYRTRTEPMLLKTKRLIELNCGRLYVASPRLELGYGTLFRVEFPHTGRHLS
jgi:nitrogen fixation/metabolism regulation signal transduction histidine kinase